MKSNTNRYRSALKSNNKHFPNSRKRFDVRASLQVQTEIDPTFVDIFDTC